VPDFIGRVLVLHPLQMRYPQLAGIFEAVSDRQQTIAWFRVAQLTSSL
jgi:hypothetical protein